MRAFITETLIHSHDKMIQIRYTRCMKLSILPFLFSVKIMSATIFFKPLTQSDLPLLFAWFRQPYIAQLWAEPSDYPIFEQKWLSKLHNSLDTTHRYIACDEHGPFGYIHYYHVNDNDRSHFPNVAIPAGSVGMDLFIADQTRLGKGLGTQMIKSFIAHLKAQEPACPAIIIDPAPDNTRAIACYKKVGFEEVGEFVVPYGGPAGIGPGATLLMKFTF